MKLHTEKICRILNKFIHQIFTAKIETEVKILRHESVKKLKVGEGTLPWAIFRFRIFSNCFSVI